MYSKPGCGTPVVCPRHLPQLLRALHPLFGSEEEAAVRDSAASAVARILDALPGAVPLDQVRAYPGRIVAPAPCLLNACKRCTTA